MLDINLAIKVKQKEEKARIREEKRRLREQEQLLADITRERAKLLEEKKAMTPIEEQALDQVTGGYVSPMEILQDRLINGDAMTCPYCKTYVGIDLKNL